MRETRILLMTLWVALAITACAPKVVQVYLGARLPADEVALLRADLGASQDLASIVIRRVNGVDTMRSKSPDIEVLPGPQIVRVELLKRATGDDVVSDARAFKTISFEAEAGRVYYVRGKMLDGIGRVWIVDGADAIVSSAEVTAVPQ